jgi:diacylglycerol kinase
MVTVTMLLRSFRNAGRGIALSLRGRNMRIMIVVAIAVVAAAALCEVSGTSWAILLACIGVVLSAETMNSAMERCMDHIEPGYDDAVRDIKDLAAGAVLLVSGIAAIVGGIVLWPYVAG